jgi:hypothetical protein
MEKNIHLTVRKNLLPLFFHLFQKGICIKTQAGESIRDLLFNRLEISDEYMEKRIQTVFLNGKAVDNLGTTVLSDGDTLALSAAMPGLAGATLRRGGAFASFRQAITLSPDKASLPGREGLVTLKLFNLLVSELGPSLLARGVWVKREELKQLLETLKQDLAKGGREGTSDFGKEDLIFLSVALE